jgi:Flp pilus assembly protein TadD
VLESDLAWTSGLDTNEPPSTQRFETALLYQWQQILLGAVDGGEAEAITKLGGTAERTTALLLLDTGNDAAAEIRLRGTLTRFPDDAGAHALLGSVLGNRGTPEALSEAEALFRRAAELDPSDTESLVRLGVTLAKQGKPEEARAAWTRALELAPHRSDVAGWLARLPKTPPAK